MIEVEVNDLKNNLTRYLRLVGKGQSVLVTNRNRPVARLLAPVGDYASRRQIELDEREIGRPHPVRRNPALLEEEAIAALEVEGKLLPAAKHGHFKPFKPIKMRGKPLSQMIIEERR